MCIFYTVYRYTIYIVPLSVHPHVLFSNITKAASYDLCIYTVVKQMEEGQKKVLKDISIVSGIRKLHSIFKKQQYKRNSVHEFSDNKKSCRKPLDMEKVELKLDKDLEESFSEGMVI